MAMNPQEANISAVLDEFVYLDVQSGSFSQPPNNTLNKIIENIEKNNLNADKQVLAKIKEAIAANPDIGKMELIDQSHMSASQLGLESGGNAYSGENAAQNDLIQACAFKSPDGDLYVAYRGTGDGRWRDNAAGFTGESTPMQEAAERYFDYVYENYTHDGRIIVTGHSKGGNESQYVMFSSKYGYDIDACYSLDGQGFSDAADARFRREHPDYELRLKRTYSICGKDDPVNDLIGIRVPKENIYYVDNGEITLDNIGDTHLLGAMFKNGEIAFYYDEDGNLIHGEPGPLSVFVYNTNELLKERLTDAQLDRTAFIVMTFVEVISGKGYGYGMNEGDLTFLDYFEIANNAVVFLVDGVPVILEELLLTPEGREILTSVIMQAVEKFYSNYGIEGVIALTAGIAFVTTLVVLAWPVIGPIIEAAAIVVYVWAKIVDFVDKLGEIYEKFKDLIAQIGEFVSEAIGKIKALINKLNGTEAYVNSHPEIRVDTFKLTQYADRLRRVNSRLSALDSRINGLYRNAGLKDLWDLIHSDIMIGYSSRFAKCASYLDQTASDFEKAEKAVSSEQVFGR